MLSVVDRLIHQQLYKISSVVSLSTILYLQNGFQKNYQKVMKTIKSDNWNRSALLKFESVNLQLRLPITWVLSTLTISDFSSFLSTHLTTVWWNSNEFSYRLKKLHISISLTKMINDQTVLWSISFVKRIHTWCHKITFIINPLKI